MLMDNHTEPIDCVDQALEDVEEGINNPVLLRVSLRALLTMIMSFVFGWSGDRREERGVLRSTTAVMLAYSLRRTVVEDLLVYHRPCLC